LRFRLSRDFYPDARQGPEPTWIWGGASRCNFHDAALDKGFNLDIAIRVPLDIIQLSNLKTTT
jgi:hypothetical protein